MKGRSSWFTGKKNVWWGRPILAEILGQTEPIGENADFQSIFAHSRSAITPSEKVQFLQLLLGKPL